MRADYGVKDKLLFSIKVNKNSQLIVFAAAPVQHNLYKVKYTNLLSEFRSKKNALQN
jgi:hypothetical protein